jgi:hypothetical protein
LLAGVLIERVLFAGVLFAGVLFADSGCFVQGKSSFFGFGSLLCEGDVPGSLDVCSQLGFVEEQKCSLSG